MWSQQEGALGKNLFGAGWGWQEEKRKKGCAKAKGGEERDSHSHSVRVQDWHMLSHSLGMQEILEQGAPKHATCAHNLACTIRCQSQTLPVENYKRAPNSPPNEDPPKSGLRVSVCNFSSLRLMKQLFGRERPLPETKVFSIGMSSSLLKCLLLMVASVVKEPYHDQGDSHVWTGPQWMGPLAVA